MADLATGILLGILLILGLLIKYFRSPNKYWENLNISCTDRTSRWDSTMDTFNNKFHETYISRLKKYGRIYGCFDFGKPTLIVSDPALVKSILVKDFSIFRNTQDISEIIPPHEFMSKMLFMLRDEHWKRVRTIISPVFTTGKIKKTASHVIESTKTLLRNFSSSVKKGENNIDVKKYYEAFAMDLIANAAFAMKIDSHNDPQNDFVVNARKLFGSSSFNWRFLIFVFLPKLAKILGLPLVEPESKKFFSTVIKTIMEERKKKAEKHNDFIQMMMDASADSADSDQSPAKGSEDKTLINNKRLTYEELMANSVMFFFVAFGTTSLTLSYLSYELAVNPECQEKLIQEIDEALKDNELELTYDVIQNMKYLDMVVCEALRIYPVGTRTEREAEVDYVLEKTSTKLVKGTLISIPIYALHHDPDIYPDPEKFDPNRFSPEEKAKRDPYAYIPFSAGPRNCVGMRFALFDMKMALAYVLSQFRFKRCSETQVPLPLESGAQTPLLSAKNIILRLETRTDNVLKSFH